MGSPRNLKQAKLIAGNAAKQQGASIADRQVARTRANGQTQTDDQPYYIFNKVDNRGFIIVSGDDRMPDVLGYTDSGSFDAANLPDGFKFMLEAYAKTVEELQDGNDAVIKAVAQLKNRTRAVTEAIGPLMKSKWSQYKPFNYYCPKMEDGQNATAGCEPIALTQIMYYGKDYFDSHPNVQYPNEVSTDSGGKTNGFYTDNPFVGGDEDAEEAVLKERFREFLFEGKRWYDIRLFDKATKYSTASASRLLWPIDETTLSTNDKLVQTDGYKLN